MDWKRLLRSRPPERSEEAKQSTHDEDVKRASAMEDRVLLEAALPQLEGVCRQFADTMGWRYERHDFDYRWSSGTPIMTSIQITAAASQRRISLLIEGRQSPQSLLLSVLIEQGADGGWSRCEELQTQLPMQQSDARYRDRPVIWIRSDSPFETDLTTILCECRRLIQQEDGASG